MIIREIKKNEMRKLLNLYTHLHRKDAPLPDKSKLESIWEEIIENPLLHYFVLEFDNKPEENAIIIHIWIIKVC